MSAGDSLALLGRTIGGHFRIEEVIGEGRHSIVYRAKHEGPDEPVAIRVLKLGLSDDPASVDVFVRKWRIESSAVSGVVLGDPQLVRTIEFGTAATGVGSFAPFSASEWLEGRSLSAEIATRGPMAIKDVVLLLDPPVTALAYAHRSGVPHGSLTPRSLFLAGTADGPQVRVLDLGMWIALAEVTRNQPDAASLFVSPWAAPEHLDPSVGDVGLATDVHSLALIVAEMLLGKTILSPDAGEEEIRRVLLRPACAPKDFGLSLEGHVERVIARALLRDPSERWPDVGVFWGALRGAIADDEAGVPLASWNVDEADTARRFAMSEGIDDELTPTGLTPTGLTPTGPTEPTGTDLTPTSPASRLPDSGALPDFDENETTEMPPFAPTIEMPALRAEEAFELLAADDGLAASASPISATSPAIAVPSSIVRPPDDEDLTPVRPTSSSKTRAAKVSRGRTGANAIEDIGVKPAPNGKGPPPSVRRPQKPGDPPPEVAGSGRATGLKVTVPAPAAKIRVDDLPSVIVEDAMSPNAPSPVDGNEYRRTPMVLRTPMDDKTVVQLEPPAEQFRSPLSSPPPPAQPISRAPPTPRGPHAGGRGRSMPPPAHARHYGASERRARERRRQLFIVGAAVFAAVVVAMGILFAIRGILMP